MRYEAIDNSRSLASYLDVRVNFSRCRRRFRFSLRALFVAVTVCSMASGWVAEQLDWIKRRRQAVVDFALLEVDSPGLRQAPLCLRLFGETGVYWIATTFAEGSAEISTVRALFPEADVTPLPEKSVQVKIRCFLAPPAPAENSQRDAL